MLLRNRFWMAEWKHPVRRCEAPDAAQQQAKFRLLQRIGAMERLDSMLRDDRGGVSREQRCDEC
jgi:hypothetical protein